MIFKAYLTCPVLVRDHYPYPYCKVAYTDFCDPRRKICQSNLRTLGDIRYWHQKFKEHCQLNYSRDPTKGKKDAMDFYNCIEEPLFNLPDDTYIWDILPLFELHLRLGFINNLVKELNDKWSTCSQEDMAKYFSTKADKGFCIGSSGTCWS